MTLMRSTPIHPLQSLFPFLPPFKEKRKKDRRESRKTNCSYRIWGPGFSPPSPFSRTAACCWSDLTQDSFHGNVEAKKTSITVTDCNSHTADWRRRPPQAKLEQSAFQSNGKESQPMRDRGLLTDSCCSHSGLPWRGQRLCNGMCRI